MSTSNLVYTSFSLPNVVWTVGADTKEIMRKHLWEGETSARKAHALEMQAGDTERHRDGGGLGFIL